MKNNKNGITLIVLVVTIIVGIIVASAGIAAVSSAITEATKASFAEELKLIEDEVSVYLLQNDEYPGEKDDSENFRIYSPNEISQNIIKDTKKFNKLAEEMKLNKENGEEDITEDTQLAFYVIDLDKLTLDKKTRGIKKNGSKEDVYVISAKTNRVYYLKGVKTNGTTYFSLVNLMKYANKVISTEMGEVGVTPVGSLTVKRAKKTWTNTMGMTLNVEDATSGAIFATLKDGETTISSSNFTLQSEYEINSLADILGASFSSEDQNTFYNANNKVIEFTKENDSLKVDLSNYDIISPEILISSVTKNIVENENIITFKVRDTQSGIKMVRYDYLQIYDENGNLKRYYKDTDNLEPAFIKARGKKADISDPDENGYVTVTIRLPYKIEGIQVYIADKAGNYAKDLNGNPIKIGIYDFDNDPYIGCELNSITKLGLTFKAVFNTNDETEVNLLTSYNVQVSTDNVTYIGDYSEILETPSVKYSKLINNYKSAIQIEKSAYVKITATIADTTYTRIFKFDISEGGKLEEESIETPPIPNGFVASEVTGETEIDTGFVIYEGEEAVTDANVDTARTTRDQFVWVPVENVEEFKLENEPGSRYLDINWEFYFMYESIKEYGGFYIGRYETSIDNDTGIIYSVANKLPKDVSDYLVGGLDSNTNSGAIGMARGRYSFTRATKHKDPVSTLVYGLQWDATVSFLKKNYSDIATYDGAEKYGNYKDNDIAGRKDKAVLLTTGSKEATKTNNIYDMCGNMKEYTMEPASVEFNMFFVRGGSYKEGAGNDGIAVRDRAGQYSSNSSFDKGLGFRLALYLR